MTNVIIILGLLLPFAGVGFYLYLQIKKAGRNEVKLKAEENANAELSKENKELANRPRTLRDRVNRLQQWRDKLPKNKD